MNEAAASTQAPQIPVSSFLDVRMVVLSFRLYRTCGHILARSERARRAHRGEAAGGPARFSEPMILAVAKFAEEAHPIGLPPNCA